MADAQDFEQEMFLLLEQTPDLVCIAGKDGYFRKINPAVLTTLGYTKEELFSKPIASFIHPDDQATTGKRRQKLLEGETLLNFQNRYLTKEGDIVWLEWTSIYSADKEIVFAIAKNVTSRKKAERELEEKYASLESLAAHFKTSLEKDRKYFAIELHEELAQLAAVVKIDIDFINEIETSLSPASRQRLDHASSVSRLLINSIRRISFSVSPDMLDDLGLDESIKWLCHEFTALTHVPATFEGRYTEHALTREVQLDFFRICQEALQNIAQHAEAKIVMIKIYEMNDEVCLGITDDGKGFTTTCLEPKTGINNMLKRTASING
ncbi:MAG TPA: PAS domain S-box protein, partial [Chitinophagaceae bacterium]|nr:PAS domain S-box protein [Chitinophagaceae bacterium]